MADTQLRKSYELNSIARSPAKNLFDSSLPGWIFIKAIQRVDSLRFDEDNVRRRGDMAEWLKAAVC